MNKTDGDQRYLMCLDLGKVVEECAELIHAIQRLLKLRGSVDLVIEEAADVYVMVNKIRATDPELFDSIVEAKLERTERRANG